MKYFLDKAKNIAKMGFKMDFRAARRYTGMTPLRSGLSVANLCRVSSCMATIRTPGCTAQAGKESGPGSSSHF